MFNVVREDKNWFIVMDGVERELGPYPTRKNADKIVALLERAEDVLSSRHASDLENAAMIAELSAAGLSQTAIAAFFDKQETWISFINKLNQLPESLLDYLRDGTVKATTLVKATSSLPPDHIERIIDRIVAQKRRNGSRTVRISARQISELTSR